MESKANKSVIEVLPHLITQLAIAARNKMQCSLLLIIATTNYV